MEYLNQPVCYDATANEMDFLIVRQVLNLTRHVVEAAGCCAKRSGLSVWARQDHPSTPGWERATLPEQQIMQLPQREKERERAMMYRVHLTAVASKYLFPGPEDRAQC